MNVSALFLIVLIVLVSGCEEQAAQTEISTDDSLYTDPLLMSVELSGILIAPTGDTVQTVPGSDVILYYWLPLDKYDEMQHDLNFLASLDSSYIVLPVQPDHESRNHAQRVVNNMGISLSVCLADSAIMESIYSDILPICVLLTPEGDAISETGFGAPSRILNSIHSGR